MKRFLFALAAASTDFDDIATLRREIKELRSEVLRRVLDRNNNTSRRLQSPPKWYETECPTSSDSNIIPGGMQSDTTMTVSSLDTIWMLLAGVLVFFMQAGFAMLECGAVRAKNAQHILLKNIVDICVGALVWWIFGFAWAYGYTTNKQRSVDSVSAPCFESVGGWGNVFAGNTHYGLSNVLSYCDKAVASSWTTAMDAVPLNTVANFTKTDSPHCTHTSVPFVDDSDLFKNWFFQFAFCATAATIVSGGIAERMKLPGYIVISLCMSGFIYPVVVAWTWSGNGWTADKEGATYYDFAGSGVVHLTGGIGALIGAIFAGPRMGRFHPSSQGDFVPHSVPLLVLGTFILWFGWYGFNAGSTLGMSDGKVAFTAALVMVNTTIAASTSGLVAFTIELMKSRKYDVVMLCNGILAGLVSITAPCGNVQPWAAFIIGVIGALIFQGSSILLRRLHIDDPLDAFAIHGACGVWGVIAAAIFDLAGDGFFYGWGDGSSVWYNSSTAKWDGVTKGEQLGQQLLVILAIVAWVGGCSIILFGSLRWMGLLCVNEWEQELGADMSKHKPTVGYVLPVQANLKLDPPTPQTDDQDSTESKISLCVLNQNNPIDTSSTQGESQPESGQVRKEEGSMAEATAEATATISC